jgi:adenylate kinase family enzyme
MAGAGKSFFSRALSTKTGLPVIHLDVHFWKPSWTEPSEDEWREKQQGLLATDEWITDGNDHATLDRRLERADTVVFLDTPWWICAWRAFVRGIRKRPVGFQLPEGCEESALRRLRDEWRLAWRIGRVRRSERDLELGILSRKGNHVQLYCLALGGRSATSSVHRDPDRFIRRVPQIAGTAPRCSSGVSAARVS